MVNFVKLAKTAKRLVEANGRSSTLFRRNRTPSNPAEPWRGPATTPSSAAGGATLGPVKVAYVPASGSGFGTLLADTDGTLTRRISQVGLLAADSVDALSPAPAETDVGKYDSIEDASGNAFKIVEVGRLQPADKVLLYVLGLEA